MICEQCLRTHPVELGVLTAMCRLGTSLLRGLRSALASLAQLG